MIYQIAAIKMTLSDLHGHSPTANLFKCVFRAALQQLTRFELTYAVRLR